MTFHGLSNGTTLKQIQSGRMVPLISFLLTIHFGLNRAGSLRRLIHDLRINNVSPKNKNFKEEQNKMK